MAEHQRPVQLERAGRRRHDREIGGRARAGVGDDVGAGRIADRDASAVACVSDWTAMPEIDAPGPPATVKRPVGEDCVQIVLVPVRVAA